MNYFEYATTLKKSNPYKSWLVFQTLYNSSLKYYAMKIYGNRWEDALDAAYAHIVENFDTEKGELEHYATTVVGTINLGMYRHEISNDEVVELSLNELQAGDTSDDPQEVVLSYVDPVESSTLAECIDYLLPYYIKDFKFFTTKKSSDRNYSYNELYRMFGDSVIVEAVNYLNDNCFDSCKSLYELKKSLKFRNYPPDRVYKSKVNSIKYLGECNGIVIYKKGSSKSAKAFYEINVQEVVSDIIKYFYRGILNRSINGLNVNCSLSGQLICDYDELFNQLENEVLGCIVSKYQAVGVVNYVRNKSLLLVGSMSMTNTVTLNILSKEFVIKMKQKSAKCV